MVSFHMLFISKVYPPAKDGHGYFYKLLFKKSLTKYLIKKKPVTESKDSCIGNVKSSHGEQVSTREKAEMKE